MVRFKPVAGLDRQLFLRALIEEISGQRSNMRVSFSTLVVLTVPGGGMSPLETRKSLIVRLKELEQNESAWRDFVWTRRVS